MVLPYESLREITKAAIENNVITFQKYTLENDSEIEKQNEFNAKQLNDFIVKLAHTFEDLHNDKL